VPVVAALAVEAVAAFPRAASATDDKIDSANRACVIVDDTGRVSFYSIGDEQFSDGDDRLKPSTLARIRPPQNMSCGSGSGADACVITDAEGDGWVESTRPGLVFSAPVTRIATPGPRLVAGFRRHGAKSTPLAGAGAPTWILPPVGNCAATGNEIGRGRRWHDGRRRRFDAPGSRDRRPSWRRIGRVRVDRPPRSRRSGRWLACRGSRG